MLGTNLLLCFFFCCQSFTHNEKNGKIIINCNKKFHLEADVLTV